MNEQLQRRVRAKLGFVTRPRATELIAEKKGLTDRDQEFHQIYRQLGRDVKNGMLPSETLGGGRIIQISNENLAEYANKYFNVVLFEGEDRPSMYGQQEHTRTLELIHKVIDLYKENIVTKETAFDSILKIISSEE
jgi:hypothetical protein